MATESSEGYNGHKIWDNQVATDNFALVQEYSPYAHPWRSNAMKLEDARFGRQYSRGETEQLLAFRQAPLPISISTAISDTADALQVSAKPTVSVSPIIHPYNDAYTQQSQQVAGVFKHLIQKDWYDSLGGLQYDRAIFDRTTVGHGLLYAAPRMEFGEFSVDVKNINWKYYFPDPAAKNPLYDDSDNQLYAMPISKKAAYRFVQSIEPDLTYEQFLEDWGKGGGFVKAFPEEDRTFGRKTKDSLLFCQRLTIESDYSYVIIPQKASYNQGDIDSISYRTSSQITEGLKAEEREGLIKIKPVRKMYLTEYTSIGSLGYKIVYPIDTYNIVPIQYDHRGTPYPYSLMWQLYPLQRALNKFVMSSILNMALLNTTKVLAEEDSIVNEDSWIQSASMPNAILKYRLNVPGVSKPPDIVRPTPMDAAFLQMPQFMIKMMEYVSSIYGIMQGNTEGAPSVFSTVASLQSAGGQKIKRRQAHADASLSTLGSVIGKFYKEYAPMNGFSYRENEKGEEEIVKYNELKVDKTNIKKPKVSVNPENDLRKGFRKVRFISTGSMGYESATEAAMLTNLATQLKLPGLVPAILERMNIPGLKDITDSMDENKQLKASNEQLQEMASKLEKETEKKNNQLFQMAVNLKGATAKGNFDVELQKFKDNPMEYMKKAFTMQGED
jgi:hypothetical protein